MRNSLKAALLLTALVVILGPVALPAATAPTATKPSVAPVASSTAIAPSAWSFDEYQRVTTASGRKMPLSREAFDRVQTQKAKAVKAAEEYLKGKLGSADERIVAAFRQVPREYFHYNYQSGVSFAGSAYEIPAKPWAVGYGSALSDYLGQLYMTQLAAPAAEQTVLEVGTGSGYQISLLSRLVKEAYSVEILQPLGEGVARIFAPLDYDNVHTRVGDGYFGWPEVSAGFDLIIVTCAAPFVPPDLLKQLKPGGKMIIPIGQPFKRGQFLYIYTKDAAGKIHSKKDMGVYFIPMRGAIEKKP